MYPECSCEGFATAVSAALTMKDVEFYYLLPMWNLKGKRKNFQILILHKMYLLKKKIMFRPIILKEIFQISIM